MELGSDFSGATDLSPAMPVVNQLLAAGHAIVRRLTTTRGTLLDYPDYGYNVRELIGTVLTSAEEVRQSVLYQCYQEESVDQATVFVVYTNGVLRINITLYAAQDPLTFTLLVSDLSVDVIIPEV